LLYAIYWLYNVVFSIIIYNILIGKIPILDIFSISYWYTMVFALWPINWLMTVYASSRWYTFKWQFAMSFFIPFYAVTFPAMVVYARFTRYKKIK